jgi:hypothetical protein
VVLGLGGVRTGLSAKRRTDEEQGHMATLSVYYVEVAFVVEVPVVSRCVVFCCFAGQDCDTARLTRTEAARYGRKAHLTKKGVPLGSSCLGPGGIRRLMRSM